MFDVLSFLSPKCFCRDDLPSWWVIKSPVFGKRLSMIKSCAEYVLFLVSLRSNLRNTLILHFGDPP